MFLENLVHTVSDTNIAAMLSSGVREYVSLCLELKGCECLSHTGLPQNVFLILDGSEKHVKRILLVLFARG